VSRAETCQRSTCGHDVDTHHEATFMRWSTDGLSDYYTARVECTAAWCQCPRYQPPKEEP
jgi:hypothetical protein